MNKVLLDTDILSMLMRGNSEVLARSTTYLTSFPRLSFSVITLYEALRGLKVKNAQVQLNAFERFSSVNEVVPLSREIADVASDIYASLHKGGRLIGEADTLIAATAKYEGLTLVTNNTHHFNRVSGLTIENWSI